MRIEIVFSADGDLIMPFHYNLFLQGLAYSFIQDVEMKNNLHNVGATFRKRVFKPFTFSNLMANFQIDNSKFVFQSPVRFQISTNLKELTKELINSIISNDTYELNHQRIRITSLRMIPEPNFSNTTFFKTLSPITTFNTLTNNDGSKYTRFYEPKDPDFARILKLNLIKKANAMYDLELDSNDFNFKPVEFNPKQMKTIIYKGTIIKAWSGVFELTASDDFKKIGYEVGFGAKNAQGFGCVDVLK